MKIIYSSEKKFIKEYALKIKDAKSLSFDQDLDINKNILNLISKIEQSSLFSNNKSYIVNNCDILSKKIDESISNQFEKMRSLKIEIHFLVNNDKLTSQSFLSKYFELINIPKMNYWSASNMIEKLLKENNIKYDLNTIQHLKNRLPYDPWVIENEIKKVVLNTNELTQKFIEENIIDYNNENIYKMIDFYLKKNYLKSLSIFEEIYSQKKSIDEIIASFISYIYNLKVMSIFYNNNKSSLVKEFKIMEFQEKEYLKIFNKISYDNINKILDILVELDKGIKKGTKDPYNSFKLFISGGYDGD